MTVVRILRDHTGTRSFKMVAPKLEILLTRLVYMIARRFRRLDIYFHKLSCLRVTMVYVNFMTFLIEHCFDAFKLRLLSIFSNLSDRLYWEDENFRKNTWNPLSDIQFFHPRNATNSLGWMIKVFSIPNGDSIFMIFLHHIWNLCLI